MSLQAVIGSNPEVLAALLQKAPALVNSRDADGDTPLHFLCYDIIIQDSNVEARLKVLLHAGADPGLLNENGRTPPGILRSSQVFFEEGNACQGYSQDQITTQRECMKRMISIMVGQSNDAEGDAGLWFVNLRIHNNIWIEGDED